MKKARDVFSMAGSGDEQKMARDQSESALRSIMAKRFKASRDMNGLGQTEAARKIGWSNATQLSIIEEGRGRMCPMWALEAASRVYGVSVDYLIGVSDEPERDPKLSERKAVMRNVHGMMMSTAETIVERVHLYMASGAPSIVTARRFIASAEELVEAVNRMYEINRQAFDEDLRGAATVVAKMDNLRTVLLEVKGQLERHDRMSEQVIKEAGERIGKSWPLLDDNREEGQSKALF